MDLSWLTIAVTDISWLSLVFVLGFLSRIIGLPPLVGFLVAGFIMNTQDSINAELFNKLADIGITLLLFTIGLKINLKQLIKPYVWIVSGLHMSLVVVLFGSILFGLSMVGITALSSIDTTSAFIIAFALSFSSTVYVVKSLEDKGELKSLHGSIAIGVLIMQDIAAVIFLAISSNKLPSVWALSLLLLLPLKYLLSYILKKVGYGELLILFGFILAIGGGQIFEWVQMKGDLGALIMGMLIASQPKAGDLAKSMMGFKDLFLLGFFVSIGLSGQISWQSVIIASVITVFIFVKSALFFWLFLRFKLRARTALLSALDLGNYSEFGLIVAAIASTNNWLEPEWLIIIAIAMSFSFIISAVINAKSNSIYSQNKPFFRKWQHSERIAMDYFFDFSSASIMIVGMGTMGKGAYTTMVEHYPNKVVGVDIDSHVVNRFKDTDFLVIQGDPSDTDFWDRMQKKHTIDLILLTLPEFSTMLEVIEQLHEAGYTGQIAAATKYDEDIQQLQEKGIMTVANIFTNAGAGFANQVMDKYLTLNNNRSHPHSQ